MHPLFSLLYTSARQHDIAGVIQRWERAARLPLNNLQWCITTDGGQWAGAWDGTLDKIKAGHHAPLQPEYIVEPVKNPPWNCNRGWNHAANLSTGSILVMVSDDLEPCDDWDGKILQAALAHTEPFGEWVMHVEDGSGEGKLTHPILSRKRFESQGCFFYPHYESMYNDTELWEVALRDKVVIDARHILIKHNHFYFGARDQDAVDKVQTSECRYGRSRQIYEWRKSQGFPKASSQAPVTHGDYTLYMQVDRDDFFLMEICQRLFDEGVRKFVFDVPAASWSGQVTPAAATQRIGEVAVALSQQGAVARMWHSAVPTAPTRIESETMARNAALAKIRAMGEPFILIADGDELWVPGTLAKIHALASEGVQSIAVPMVSMAGLPPYPIRDGKDLATVYIGPDNALRYCRAPWLPDHGIWEPLIYHFTATRRTLALLQQKMRDSGHYQESVDGLSYDFEKWLAETLPAIKPGAKNVHMHDTGMLWPTVDNWTAADFRILPKKILDWVLEQLQSAATNGERPIN